MTTTKLYSAMTPTEREEWLKDYRQWLSADFPRVEGGQGDVRTVVEHGLRLIAVFPYCRAFVQESLAVRDYGRRLRVLRRYADKVTAEVERQLQKTVDLTDPALLIPHVGRPTKEEVAARTLAKQRAMEEERTLFNQQPTEPATEPQGTDALPPFQPPLSAGLGGNRLPSLSEIRWLMSPSLQGRADEIRDLRSRAEEAATRAKQMAEDKRHAPDIEPQAKEAARCFGAVEAIYEAIDREMQTVYVRLNEDTAFIKEITAKSRLDNKELRTLLRPYWDKLSTEEKEAKKAAVIQWIKDNDPQQAAIRKAAEERKAAVDAIIKYLQRKDKPNTLKRLFGMERKLEELHTLIGAEADNYVPLLTAARNDYETNIKPAEEHRKAEREARKKGKK